MGVVGRLFAYAKLVVMLVGRMVSKVLSMGAAPFAELRTSFLSAFHGDEFSGTKHLLKTESGDDAAQKEIAREWVEVPEEDTWEPGGRELLTDLLQQGKDRQSASCGASESGGSQTEDELVELSDGEDRATLMPCLRGAKRSSPESSQASVPAN